MPEFYCADDALSGAQGYFVKIAENQWCNAVSVVKLRMPVAGRLWHRAADLIRYLQRLEATDDTTLKLAA